MKLWYDIKAKASNPKIGQVTVFEEIGIWGVSGKRFAEDLKQHADKDSIELLINSPGGSVFDALLMFNALRAMGKPITAKVMGLAASAASYLAMAGDTIEMPENTFMMVHNPLAGMYGNANDHREFADVLDKVGGQLLNTYVKRTGKDEKELKQLFDAESYLSAEECKALGLCDTVTAAFKVAAVFDPDRPGVPEVVQKSLKAQAEPEPDPEPKEPEADPDDTVADRVKARAEKLGLGEFVAVFALNDKTFEQIDAVMLEAREIKALCIVAEVPDQAAELIRARKTLPEARAAITTALAAKADAAHSSNVPNPKGKNQTDPEAKPSFSPTNYWKQQQAKQTA